MLKTLNIENFTCFPEANLEFSRGLNVIVGENGTGKTHLLKLGYTALYVASQLPEKADDKEKEVMLRNALKGIFKTGSVSKLFAFKEPTSRVCKTDAKLDNAEISFSFNIEKQAASESLDVFESIHLAANGEIVAPLFIPAKEILSIYPGLAHAIRNRELAFDATYLHLADALSAVTLKDEALSSVKHYAVLVEQTIEAICVKQDDKFLLVPFAVFDFRNDRQQFTEFPAVEAHLAAEGHRKIGMLSYLVRNGSLRPGSSLFWDEPEANLNPKTLKKLAAVLVELAQIMQITIATHSLFLLRELEILQENKKLENARYFGLHLTGHGVEVRQGGSSDDIGDLAVLDASIAQSEEYMNLQYTR